MGDVVTVSVPEIRVVQWPDGVTWQRVNFWNVCGGRLEYKMSKDEPFRYVEAGYWKLSEPEVAQLAINV